MSDIRADYERVERALKTPALKLLDRKSASTAMPIFLTVFPENAHPIPVDRFHTQVETLLEELRGSGYTVAKGTGKSLAMQWVKERWLFRDPGSSEETYQLTGDAKQAIDYAIRSTRQQANVSASRIESLRRAVSEAALTANPDREKRKDKLRSEIEKLQDQLQQLESADGPVPTSEAELIEHFANVLRELDGLPSDFRRVEEAVRAMHKDITASFRAETRPVGEVVADYLEKSRHLLESTLEGRAFAGALQLFRHHEWLQNLKSDLETLLTNPRVQRMPEDQQRQLYTAVDVIRRGNESVLDQRQRLSATLREHIENYDHMRNRELEKTLRGVEAELTEWMKSARARDHIDVEVLPAQVHIDTLQTRFFDPNSERVPDPLENVSEQMPQGLSLSEIRQQGGPSLGALRQRVRTELGAGRVATLAHMFEELPPDLKRPVEIIGMLQIFAELNAEADPSNREKVTAVRPDGSTRSFSVAKTTPPRADSEASKMGKPSHTGRERI